MPFDCDRFGGTNRPGWQRLGWPIARSEGSNREARARTPMRARNDPEREPKKHTPARRPANSRRRERRKATDDALREERLLEDENHTVEAST